MTAEHRRVHAPLPAARAALGLSSHPPLRLPRQRQPQARHRPLASCCISLRPRLAPNPARAAPITVTPDPPSCADTAAPRCSSSRPSRAPSTSADHRDHWGHHDRNFSIPNRQVGASSHGAEAFARCLTSVSALGSRMSTNHPHPSSLCIAPNLDAHRAIRTLHRHPAHQYHRSNPHSAPPLLTDQHAPAVSSLED
jgi:hypothetical protein